ncbi:hypothetical protein ACFV2N_17570 [Streptomyces sp. NPDC059680]|uniref:hypothetical protein n=1 Tax=Streptomyces sp. NPDC059680 TaxID=3346904 RepID=UPI00368CB80D
MDGLLARVVESTRLTATGTADMFAPGAVLVAAAGGSAWGEGTPMGLLYRSVHEPPDLADRRRTVVVRLWDGGVHDCALNARRSARLGEWPARLDHVLGRYAPR